VSEDDFVPLRRFTDPVVAQMAADFLRDHGVEVILTGQHSTGILPRLYPLDVLLSVPKNKLDAATEALVAFEAGTPSGRGPGD
jgi:hypothetical protein